MRDFTLASGLELARRDTFRFLRDNLTAVVATTADGQPFASTVYYTVDEELNFYMFAQSPARERGDGSEQQKGVGETGCFHAAESRLRRRRNAENRGFSE